MINIEEYLKSYDNLISQPELINQLFTLGEKLKSLKKNGGRLLLMGNGASASIASHAALDFTKQARLEALCFHDSSLITAYANDYSYEEAFKEILISFSRDTDYVFFISVSGESENLVRAAQHAKKMGLYTVSFTGRNPSNRLKTITEQTFWVDSHAYNIVENCHCIWITTLIDYLVGKSVYEVK